MKLLFYTAARLDLGHFARIADREIATSLLRGFRLNLQLRRFTMHESTIVYGGAS